MATSPDTTRRWVATLIVLLLLAQAGTWAWRKIRKAHQPAQQASQTALQRKIAASMAYDTALLRADSLLTAADTVAAARLLDSLSQQPTDSLFPIERQKLLQLQVRLSGPQPAPAAGVRHRPGTGSPTE